MFAMQNNIQRTVCTHISGSKNHASEIVHHAGMLNIMGVISFFSSLRATTLVSLLTVCLVLTGNPAETFGLDVQVRSIAQITVDDENRPLNYPSYLFYDPFMEEIYLSNIGSGRIIVYGPDFFPRISIGIGRGVLAPYGVEVMSNGEVYICQPRTARNPHQSITILNGAFFIDREIFLDEIPETENFSPREIAVSPDGLIYVIVYNHRGVIVLDNDGNFLRQLQTMDILSEAALDAITTRRVKEEEKQKEQDPVIFVEGEEPLSDEDIYANIPEEFRPRSTGGGAGEAASTGEGLGPVKIYNITIDSKGNLYLISPETGFIYVYGPDESFLFKFGTKGGSPGQLSQPRSLAIDENRRMIYVADYMRHTILAYDMEGNFLFEFGGRGFGPGWFNFPTSVVVNKHGEVIVADLFNKRVQVLEVLYEAGFPGFEDEPQSASFPEAPVSDEAEQDEPIPEQPEAENTGENIPDSTPIQVENVPEKENIFEEEVIKPPPEVPTEPPGPFDEPLVTPE